MSELATEPLCSVVVPTYQRAELLGHTLRSLAHQDLERHEYEVIVVDDGGDDGSRDVVAAFADRMGVTYHWQPDAGYRVAKARNVGIRNARAPITVLVDSGVLLAAGSLRAHLAAHAATDGPAAVIGYVHCFNEDNEDAAMIEAESDYAEADATIRHFSQQRRWPDLREPFYETAGDEFGDLPAPWLFWWCCNASAPTGLLRDAGWFDENYRQWGAEDVDMAYRLHRDGARVVLARAALSMHIPHPKSYAANMAAAAANYAYFAQKYDTPIARLVPHHHFHDINDLVRVGGLPTCAEHRAQRARRPVDVLVFSPHPDDEVIACGGTLIGLAAQGRRARVVHSTDGAQSHAAVLDIHDDPTPAELIALRREEARAAAVALGHAADDVEFLDFPDTALADHLPQFRQEVLRVLKEHPDVTEVYLPHEVRELNADHRLTGETVLSCLAELGRRPALRKFVVWDEQTEADFAFVNRKPADRAADAEEPTITVDISVHRERKRAAFAAHRTQVELFVPSQTRPVVPWAVQERVHAGTVETFYVEAAQ